MGPNILQHTERERQIPTQTRIELAGLELGSIMASEFDVDITPENYHSAYEDALLCLEILWDHACGRRWYWFIKATLP